MADALIIFTPSQELLASFPEFTKLEIYGSTHEPFFLMTDIQTLVGIARFRLDRDYVENKHYVRVEGKTSDGKRRTRVMFTEAGLYRVLLRSHTDLGEKFMDFITIVMRELRTKGEVTLSTALKKLELQNKMLDDQLEEEHDKLIKQTALVDKYWKKNTAQWQEILILKDQQRNQAPRLSSDVLLDRIKEKMFSTIYIYLAKPPKELAEEFEDDELDVTDDQEICFEVSNKKRGELSVAEFYVPPKTSLTRIKDYLDNNGFNIDCTTKRIHRGTLDGIRDLIDKLIAE